MGDSHAGQGLACIASSFSPLSHLSVQATRPIPISHLRGKEGQKKVTIEVMRCTLSLFKDLRVSFHFVILNLVKVSPTNDNYTFLS